MNRIAEASSYLEAVSVGIRQSTPAELPLRLEEIARNLESLAKEARYALNVVPEIDDTHL